MQGVNLNRPGAWGGGPETVDQVVERFGRLAEAGVQHIIISSGDAHDPDAIELIARDVMPQLRDVESADPRTVGTAPAS